MLLSLTRGDPAFSMLQPVHDWDARGGVPVVEPWVEAEFAQSPDARDAFIAVDCLTMNTGADGFLLSDHARGALAPLLGATGEFWPVRVLGRRYWWLNCMAHVDALDRENTDADWSVVDGDWGSFSWISSTRRLAFRQSRLRGAPILFRVPEYPQGILFAQEAMRLAVERHGLTGFRFDPVWSSRDGGVVDPAGMSFGGTFEPVSMAELDARRQWARDVLAQRDAEN